MRVLKVVGIFLCMLTLAAVGLAGTNSMGVRDVSHVTFVAPMHVGTVVLPAWDFVVRHTTEGSTHVMVFQRAQSKDEFKMTCTLVPLSQKAREDQTIYELNGANERVLQSLVFKGDTTKHVF